MTISKIKYRTIDINKEIYRIYKEIERQKIRHKILVPV